LTICKFLSALWNLELFRWGAARFKHLQISELTMANARSSLICRILILFSLMLPSHVLGGSLHDLPDLALQAIKKTHSEIITESEHSWKISASGETPIVNESIKIEVLKGVSKNPVLRSSNHVDFSSLSAIVRDVTSPEMTEEQKAKALWRFTMNNLYGGSWGTSADGLEHLNVYGYGFCGTFTAVLEPLWWAAGLRARHVNIGNHAATEVYYDNDWHYLDAHLRSFFLEKDNHTIASLEDLDNDLDLWDMKRLKQSSQKSREKYYYMTMHPRGHGNSPIYSRDFTMATGDVLELTWRKNGQWCLARGAEGGAQPAPEPPIYANGAFKFSRDLRKPDHWRNGVVSSKNIDWEDYAAGYIHPLKAKEDAQLVYKVNVPYFIASADILGKFQRKHPSDFIGIDISTDNGGHWLPQWHAKGTGILDAIFSISSTQEVTTRVAWKYSYLIRIRMRATQSPLDVGAYLLESTAHIVYNPVSLSALSRGANTITLSDETDSPRSVKLTYNWFENLPIRISKENPLEGEKVSLTALVSNLGPGSATNVSVVFHLGDPHEGGVEIGRDVIRSIKPGGVGEARIKWKATRRSNSKRKAFETIGAEIYVTVDPDNSIHESTEANNSYSRVVRVLHRPEVRIPGSSFIRFEKKDNHPGLLKITASIRNYSNDRNYGFYLDDHAAATDVLIKFFDGKPDRKNQIGSDLIIDRLRPLEFRNVSVDWDISKQKGKHTIYVQASPGKNFAEALGRRQGDEAAITIDLDAYRSFIAEK